MADKDVDLTDSGIGSVVRPYAWWHLNETTGLNVSDASGNSRSGTGSGITSSWVAAKLNNGLLFTGSEYVDFGNIANYERTDKFSLECWLKTTGGGSNQTILSRIQPSAPYRGWRFQFNPSGYIQFEMISTSGSNSQLVRSNTTYNDGNWHYVVITYDGSSSASGIKIYVAGSLVATTTVTDSLTATTQNAVNCFMGKFNGIGEFFSGTLDEFVLYGKELNIGEVKVRYNSGTGTETMPGVNEDTDLSHILSTSDSSTGSSTLGILSPLSIPESSSGSSTLGLLASLNLSETPYEQTYSEDFESYNINDEMTSVSTWGFQPSGGGVTGEFKVQTGKVGHVDITSASGNGIWSWTEVGASELENYKISLIPSGGVHYYVVLRHNDGGNGGYSAHFDWNNATLQIFKFTGSDIDSGWTLLNGMTSIPFVRDSAIEIKITNVSGTVNILVSQATHEFAAQDSSSPYLIGSWGFALHQGESASTVDDLYLYDKKRLLGVDDILGERLVTDSDSGIGDGVLALLAGITVNDLYPDGGQSLNETLEVLANVFENEVVSGADVLSEIFVSIMLRDEKYGYYIDELLDFQPTSSYPWGGPLNGHVPDYTLTGNVWVAGPGAILQDNWAGMWGSPGVYLTDPLEKEFINLNFYKPRRFKARLWRQHPYLTQAKIIIRSNFDGSESFEIGIIGPQFRVDSTNTTKYPTGVVFGEAFSGYSWHGDPPGDPEAYYIDIEVVDYKSKIIVYVEGTEKISFDDEDYNTNIYFGIVGADWEGWIGAITNLFIEEGRSFFEECDILAQISEIDSGILANELIGFLCSIPVSDLGIASDIPNIFNQLKAFMEVGVGVDEITNILSEVNVTDLHYLPYIQDTIGILNNLSVTDSGALASELIDQAVMKFVDDASIFIYDYLYIFSPHTVDDSSVLIIEELGLLIGKLVDDYSFIADDSLQVNKDFIQKDVWDFSSSVVEDISIFIEFLQIFVNDASLIVTEDVSKLQIYLKDIQDTVLAVIEELVFDVQIPIVDYSFIATDTLDIFATFGLSEVLVGVDSSLVFKEWDFRDVFDTVSLFSETESILVDVPIIESLTGYDLPFAWRPVELTDAASLLAETLAILVSLSLSDAGALTNEDIGILANIYLSDALGLNSELLALLAQVPISDTSLDETEQLTVGVNVSLTEVLTVLSETISILVSLGIEDQNTLVVEDIFRSLLIQIVVGDSSSLIQDLITIEAGIFVNDEDLGVVENLDIFNNLPILEDSGLIASEIISAFIALEIIDNGNLNTEIIDAVRLAFINDAGSIIELLNIYAQIFAIDDGLGADIILAMYQLSVADNSQAVTELVALFVQVFESDINTLTVEDINKFVWIGYLFLNSKLSNTLRLESEIVDTLDLKSGVNDSLCQESGFLDND